MVSIIVVNYNNYSDTLDCLKSLRNITYPEFRIIVIDNNSTDNSVKFLKQNINNLEFELIEADYNGGFSYGNNLGIKRGFELGTDYFVLLNNDTIVEKNFLDELLVGFNLDEECGATIGKIKYEKDKNRIWYAGGSVNKLTAQVKHWKYDFIDNDKDLSSRYVTFATGCCLCLSKEAIQKVGLLDESIFLYEEDLDYSIRLIKAGYKIIYMPKSVIYHKVNASSKSIGNTTLYYRINNKLYVIKKHFKGFNKIIAYCFLLIQCFYKCIKKEYRINNVIDAVSNYFKKQKE